MIVPLGVKISICSGARLPIYDKGAIHHQRRLGRQGHAFDYLSGEFRNHIWRVSRAKSDFQVGAC